MSRPSWLELLRAEEGEDAPMVLAADRCEFRLNYARAAEPRPMLGNTLDGDDIPNAYGDGKPGDVQAGEWYDGDDPKMIGRDTEEAWVDFYAGMGVKEAIHEALEWFRVDGRPWLDPHGATEGEIHELSARFACDLAKLRAKAEAWS